MEEAKITMKARKGFDFMILYLLQPNTEAPPLLQL